MSEDRVFVIYAQNRSLLIDEDREYLIFQEARGFSVDQEDRVMEAYGE
jgi:hypothetical protein